MPRFVLLYHDCPLAYERPSHWDLMLEDADALATWAIAELPALWANVRARTAQRHADCASVSASDDVAVERLADHRAAYLEYEGPVSGGRGQVSRLAAGTYELLARDDESWIIVAGRSHPTRMVGLSAGCCEFGRWIAPFWAVVYAAKSRYNPGFCHKNQVRRK
jgi:hypothetical protein